MVLVLVLVLVVLVLVLVLVVLVVVVDATICATDMHCRYALPIWCDDMQGLKTEKAKSMLLLAPDVVCFCDSLLYFCFLTHLIIFPISVGTMPAIKS